MELLAPERGLNYSNQKFLNRIFNSENAHFLINASVNHLGSSFLILKKVILLL